MRSFQQILSIAGALTLIPAPALAQDAQDWEFTFAPYLLAPSMEGDVEVRGRPAEADISAGDIFSNLNFGFMGYLEANNGIWGAGADIIYSNLDANEDDADVELDSTLTIATAQALVRVSPAIELYGGLRYYDVGLDAEFQDASGLDSRSVDKSWVDPLVGARIAGPMGGRWRYAISADIGGFGLGSDIAVNVWPVITYQFSDSVRGAIGYRLLYTDYQSGTGDEAFAYDILMAGPTVGAVFRF